MVFLFVVVLVVGYAVVAGRLAREGGAGRLGIAALCALSIVALAATFLGWWYAVPSFARLLAYAMALTGPAVLLPTVLLWGRIAAGAARDGALATALLGALAGSVCGFLLVVYGLRVW